MKAGQKARGRYLGGIVPFGWRVGDDGELVGPDPTAILVANSLRTLGGILQGSEARAPCCGSRGIGPPRADPRQIDGDGGDDVLQAGLGQADVAALPQAAPADRLTVGSLDAGPSGIVQAERRGALLFSCGLQRLVMLACLQSDDARLALGFGAAAPQRAWCAVPGGEPGLEHRALLRVGARQP